jgi:hypothetical protein
MLRNETQLLVPKIKAKSTNNFSNKTTKRRQAKIKPKNQKLNIKQFFEPHKSKASNDQNSDNSDDTRSLNYSTSTDSDNEDTALRPSITISKNTEVSAQRQVNTNENHPNQKRFTQLKLHNSTMSNLPFGDDIMEPTEDQTILFHNINGLKDGTNWFQILTTMQEMNVDIFGIAELNQQMQRRGVRKWTDPIQKVFKYSRNVHSESKNTTESDYKPGGTMTVITGKWQSRVAEIGSDNKGLGRWSYVKINSKRRSLIIITAYRPCVSRGINTTWMQQWTILREEGEPDPDPIQKFYTDLEDQLQKWKEEKYEIILLIDANETIGDKPGGLTSVIAKAEMIDITRHCHPHEEEINTHARGSTQIDYILGTRGVSKVCSRAGILPFGSGYMSDHRALFVKINFEKLFSTNVQSIDSTAARKLTQATPKERKIFLQEANLHFESQNIYERLKKLRGISQDEWGKEMDEEFEKCDTEVIRGMLAAESKTRKTKTVAWSPKFAKAVNYKSFWKVALQLKTTHRPPSEKFLQWAESLGINDYKMLDMATVKQNLRKSQKDLKEIEKQAESLREEHLRNMLVEAELNGDEKNIQRRLKILLRAQAQQQHFKRLKSIFKPNKTGGLTYILVPEKFDSTNYPYDPNEITSWDAVHDQEAVQEFIQKRNITHFGQAQGSPFTVPPLNSINWQANNIPAKELLKGAIPISFVNNNPQLERVLRYIANRKNLPIIDTYISTEQVSKGFRRWRETTSTSPSGCHLGLRRIATYPTLDETVETMRQNILQVQTDIINLPIQNGFSPKRWQTVVNAMLEKIPGKPLLHKLRVIHILEADYNLALKQIFGKRLLKNCERGGTLGDMQDGFRKGRSTIRTLLHNELINDYNKRLRINNFIGMTDISGCFDRIVTSVISLLNIKNGCTAQAVNMHATTLQMARYHLKTKLGVSKEFYSHSENNPVYGNGQGAGDSPSQWCQQSAMLFDLYKEANTGAQISNRHGNMVANFPLAAFADDTNLLGNDDKRQMSIAEITESAQKGFSTWSELLHATGHFMELEKCSCYLSIWAFQEDGYAYTLSPEEHGQRIVVKDHCGNMKEIPQMTSETSQKILGVMRNPIGNQQDEVHRLKQKSDHMAKQISLHALSPTEAKMAYEFFYIPAMRYSLSITSINQMDFETIQRKATGALLSIMGFNRNMPREVVFSSKLYQGLSLKHLYDIQGVDGTRLLLQEVNSTSTTGQLMRATIDVIQMEAGIGRPILEDNRPLAYIEWGWIPSIRDFLHHIKAEISNASNRPHQYREGDSYIMDSPMIHEMTRKEQILINRCRIYLQVECISDIATADGTAINKSWFSSQSPKRSTSNKVWPLQNDPGKEAWNIWRNFLTRAFTDGSGKLKNKLQRWKCTAHRIYFAYYQDKKLWLYLNNDSWTVHKLRHAGRREWFFARQHTKITNLVPSGGVPIDVKSESGEWIVTDLVSERISENLSTENVPTTSASTFSEKVKARANLSNTRVNIEVDEADLEITLDQKSIIDIASDGSHNRHTGNLTYGWVIAINTTVVAKGQGRTRCPVDMAGSFRAEAYGVAAVSQVLAIMVEHYELRSEEHDWYLYIDNKTLIERLDRHRNEQEYSKWNLNPDADVVNYAHKLIKQIPMNIVHVKSHQSSGKDFNKLSLPVQMNTIADNLAEEQQHYNDKLPEVYLPFCYLKIRGKHVTKDSKRTLLEEASMIPVRQYYKDKYGWNTEIFYAINWEVQQKVLNTYPTNDQRRILKMVHGWLPTYDHLQRENQVTSMRCPLCHYRTETSIHVFTCKHPQQSETYNRIGLHLDKDSGETGNRDVNKIIKEALANASNLNLWSAKMTGNSKIDRWIQDQSRIGWHQILYGRIAKSLENAMEDHYRNKANDTGQDTGAKWVRKLIQVIWDTFLKLWIQRNELIHGQKAQQKSIREQHYVEARVNRCYEYQSRLTHKDREKIFYKTKEELLREGTRYVRAWIKLCERIISVYKKEAKERPKESRILESFIQWKPRQNPTRTKTKKQTPHQKQDLHPD